MSGTEYIREWRARNPDKVAKAYAQQKTRDKALRIQQIIRDLNRRAAGGPS